MVKVFLSNTIHFSFQWSPLHILIYFLECVELNIFLKDFFDVAHFLKVCIEFVTVLLLVYLLFCFFFGREACGILVPQPGVEPASSALGGGVLIAGAPGKSPNIFSKVQTRQKGVTQTSVTLSNIPSTPSQLTIDKKLNSWFPDKSLCCLHIFTYFPFFPLHKLVGILLMLFCTWLSSGKIPTGELLRKGKSIVLLLLSHFSRVWLCVTP